MLTFFLQKLMIIAILGRTTARVLVGGGDLSLRKADWPDEDLLSERLQAE
jgi:hypothetical protein